METEIMGLVCLCISALFDVIVLDSVIFAACQLLSSLLTLPGKLLSHFVVWVTCHVQTSNQQTTKRFG